MSRRKKVFEKSWGRRGGDFVPPPFGGAVQWFPPRPLPPLPFPPQKKKGEKGEGEEGEEGG